MNGTRSDDDGGDSRVRSGRDRRTRSTDRPDGRDDRVMGGRVTRDWICRWTVRRGHAGRKWCDRRGRALRPRRRVDPRTRRTRSRADCGRSRRSVVGRSS